MNVLFWNIGKGDGWQSLPSLVLDLEADIIFLAECSDQRLNDIVRKINARHVKRFYRSFFSGSPFIKMISRYDSSVSRIIRGASRYAIMSIDVPSARQILMVALHLQSKINASPATQYYVVRELRKDIEEVERYLGHQRTMVLGNFNLNPFEDAMVGADGLNAVMDARHLERAGRKVRGTSWSSFYNPMWSLLGDNSPGSPGSHYYASSDIVSYYWNMFDQIIFREPLLKYLTNDCIRLIETVDQSSIISGSKLDVAIADHLPLSIKLSIEGDPNG